MDSERPANEIDERAVAWLARIDRGQLTAHDRVAFEQWLAADDRHRGAYIRAEAAWRLLDRAAVQTVDVGAASPGWNRGRSRRVVVAGGIAATVAAVVGVTLRPRPALNLETALGEIKRVPLDDGSVVMINTDSSLEVRYSNDHRQVDIDRGESWFQVAKDWSRPFVVESDLASVRAIAPPSRCIAAPAGIRSWSPKAWSN